MRHDAQVNRERILAAAEEVFGEHGAVGSTEEVARRAGVGIATVFRHFPTKEALIEAALLRHFADLTVLTRELAGSGDPAAALDTLVRTMIERGSTKLTLASLLGERGEFPDSVRAAADRQRAEVRKVLRRAQDSGTVRRSVTVDEVYLLVRGLAQASATMPTKRSTLHHAVDIVLAGLAAPTAPTNQRRDSSSSRAG